jgi:N-acyl-D-aspartate/D-glutamate deacylase
VSIVGPAGEESRSRRVRAGVRRGDRDHRLTMRAYYMPVKSLFRYATKERASPELLVERFHRRRTEPHARRDGLVGLAPGCGRVAVRPGLRAFCSRFRALERVCDARAGGSAHETGRGWRC